MHTPYIKWLQLGFLIIFFQLSGLTNTQAVHPNILFIAVDDLRPKEEGDYGNGPFKTN